MSVITRGRRDRESRVWDSYCCFSSVATMGWSLLMRGLLLIAIAGVPACVSPPPTGYGMSCEDDGGCPRGLFCVRHEVSGESVCTVACDYFGDGGSTSCPNPSGASADCEFSCTTWCPIWDSDSDQDCSVGGCDIEIPECASG